MDEALLKELMETMEALTATAEVQKKTISDLLDCCTILKDRVEALEIDVAENTHRRFDPRMLGIITHYSRIALWWNAKRW